MKENDAYIHTLEVDTCPNESYGVGPVNGESIVMGGNESWTPDQRVHARSSQ